MIGDMVASAHASRLVQTCRHNAGLTQAELARLASTSQSAIAAYETGAKEPSLGVLQKIVQAAGQRLELGLRPDPAVLRLADLAEQLRATSDAQRRLRLFFEFLRGAQDEPARLRLLVAQEPALTGDPRFDALLAAAAEHLCIEQGARPPVWVDGPDRTLPGFWWVSDLPSAKARALVHAPASFRRRGVLLDRHDLDAA